MLENDTNMFYHLTYILITNKDVIDQCWVIRDPVYTIFKMMIGEKFEKAKLRFPTNQTLFIMYSYIYH